MSLSEHITEGIKEVKSLISDYEKLLLKLYLSSHPDVYPIQFLPTSKRKLRRYIIFLMYISENKSDYSKLSFLYKEVSRFQGFDMNVYSSLLEFTRSELSYEKYSELFDLYIKAADSMRSNENIAVQREIEKSNEELNKRDYLEKVYWQIYNHLTLGGLE